jgi:hypothetical protein
MRGRDKGMNTNFTTRPRNPYRPYRIVMAFNPARGRGLHVLCRTPAAAQSSLGGSRVGGKRLYLAAVFCDDTELMFAVGGSMPPLRTPRHPAFRRTVDRLMHHFVPFESMIDDIDDDDDDSN